MYRTLISDVAMQFAGCLTLLEILEMYWSYSSFWKSTRNLQSLLEIFVFNAATASVQSVDIQFFVANFVVSMNKLFRMYL